MHPTLEQIFAPGNLRATADLPSYKRLFDHWVDNRYARVANAVHDCCRLRCVLFRADHRFLAFLCGTSKSLRVLSTVRIGFGGVLSFLLIWAAEMAASIRPPRRFKKCFAREAQVGQMVVARADNATPRSCCFPCVFNSLSTRRCIFRLLI